VNNKFVIIGRQQSLSYAKPNLLHVVNNDNLQLNFHATPLASYFAIDATLSWSV